MSKRTGITNEILSESRNTFEVFLMFYEFIKDCDKVIFNHKYHINVIKFYLLSLELDHPGVRFYDTCSIISRRFKESVKEMRDEYNGFIRCYKTLLIYEDE